MDRRHRRRTTRSQGFTLLEVIVAMILTGVLVTLLLQWIGTMGQLSQVGAERSDSDRAAAYIESRFNADALAAIDCDPQRRTGTTALMSPSRVGFYRDVNRDGHADIVAWTVAAGNLYRDVFIGGGNCTFSTIADRTTVAQGVRATTPFTPWYRGQAVPLGSPVDCAAVPGGCKVDAVQLRLVIEGGSPEYPVPLDVMVPVNNQASAQPR